MAADLRLNLIHASDAPETAAEEIGNFFDDDEILSYSRTADEWISSSGE